MKKVLLLIVMMVAMMAVPVYAEEAIGLNEEKIASNRWDEYLFIPEETGLYALVISEGGEVRGQIEDENYSGIAFKEGVEDLTVVFEAEQGREYHIYVWDDEDDYGRETVCKAKIVKEKDDFVHTRKTI